MCVLGLFDHTFVCVCVCLPSTTVFELCTILAHAFLTLSSMDCCPTESEGEYQYPVLKHVQCFISSRGRGWEGGLLERPLFLSFVYVRSGSRVLGERRGLGMLELYSLGIIYLFVCTAFSRFCFDRGIQIVVFDDTPVTRCY